jgi:hypothetical protein
MPWKWLLVVSVLAAACGAGNSAPSPPAIAAVPQSPRIVTQALQRRSAAAPPPAPAAEAASSVPGCDGDETVLITEFDDGELVLREIRMNGAPVRTLLTQEEHVRPGVDAKGRLVVGRAGVVDVETGALTAFQEAARWTYPQFIPGTHLIVSPVEQTSERAPALIEIFDQRSKRATQALSGFWPSLGPAGELLFLRAARDHVDVMRFAGGAERRLKRIELSSFGRGDVTEVVALGGDDFLYRVSDEHERRYYLANDEPYYPGEEGHWLDVKAGGYHGGQSKEQHDLALSANGAWAAFAERNWNELTYLVVVDRKASRRQQTPYYGAFPAWFGDTLLFASDPQFVLGQDTTFRQIETFAIYAYRPRAPSLCRIAVQARPGSDVLPYGP